MSSFYQYVLGVMCKTPERREPDEVSLIASWLFGLFKKKSSFFGDLDLDVVKDITKNCKFETREKDEIIIRQGETGSVFYVTLRGKVSIYINHKQHDEVSELNEPAEEEDEYKAGLNDESGERFRERLGNYVTSLGVGEGFGEIALLSDNIRNATVIADEKSDFITIDRALYSRCLELPTLRRIDEKHEFINKSPFFSGWTGRMKKLLSMCLERDIMPYDSYLSKQGEPCEKMYFLKSGLAKVTIDPSTHPTQYPKLVPHDKVQEAVLAEESNPIKKCYQHSTALKRRLETFAEAEKRLKNKQIEIGLIGPGEITGMCEFVFDMGTYVQTTRCLEPCDVFFIYKQSYERLIVKRNPATVQKMRNYTYLKLSARNSRLPTVSLYKSLAYKIQMIERQTDENESERLWLKRFSLPSNSHSRPKSASDNKRHQLNESRMNTENQLGDRRDGYDEILDEESSKQRASDIQDLEDKIKNWHLDLGINKACVTRLKDLKNDDSSLRGKESVLIKRKLNVEKKLDLKRLLITESSHAGSACSHEMADFFLDDLCSEISNPESLRCKLIADSEIIELINRSNNNSEFSTRINTVNWHNQQACERKDEPSTRFLPDCMVKRKFSLAQIKLPQKRYTKEEYMALKEELKRQSRKSCSYSYKYAC